MKISLLGVLFVSIWIASCQNPQPINDTQQMETSGQLRHVVLFKFKDEAPPEAVEKIHQSFQNLPKEIPEIQDLEWGFNDSPENFHQGFTHCYLLTFKSESDRDSIYTPHPAHQAFVSSLQPHLEKVFVVDYWAN